MNKELVDKAKNIRGGKGKAPQGEEYEALALAWLKGEIGMTQVAKAIGDDNKSGHILYKISVWLRDAYRDGYLIIKD